MNRSFKLACLSAVTALIPLGASAQMSVTGSAETVVQLEELASFDGAWAMTFLPDGRSLVTEKSGNLWLLNSRGTKIARIENVPEVTERNQGGLGDIIIDPDFENNQTVYLSYVE
ncbi:MAG: PQQ-dependent sugar dehydrogenase, partial [Pricia sp.]